MPLLIRLPFQVLDQNSFRDDDQLAPAIDHARQTRGRLLVPDVAVIEMMQNEKWELTARFSLARLAKCPELVSVGRAIPELFRMELLSGQPKYMELEDAQLTPAFRELIKEVQVGDGPNLRHAREKMRALQARLAPQYMNHTRNKARVLRFRDLWSEIIPKNERKRLEDSGVRREALAHPFWADRFERELIEAGVCDPDAAHSLAHARSITSHLLLASRALALRWYIKDGLDNTDEKKVTNDLLDMDYVVAASFCDGIVTKETKVKDLLSDLEDVAERIAGRVDQTALIR